MSNFEEPTENKTTEDQEQEPEETPKEEPPKVEVKEESKEEAKEEPKKEDAPPKQEAKTEAPRDDDDWTHKPATKEGGEKQIYNLIEPKIYTTANLYLTKILLKGCIKVTYF